MRLGPLGTKNPGLLAHSNALGLQRLSKRGGPCPPCCVGGLPMKHHPCAARADTGASRAGTLLREASQTPEVARRGKWGIPGIFRMIAAFRRMKRGKYGSREVRTSPRWTKGRAAQGKLHTRRDSSAPQKWILRLVLVELLGRRPPLIGRDVKILRVSAFPVLSLASSNAVQDQVAAGTGTKLRPYDGVLEGTYCHISTRAERRRGRWI